MSGKFFHQSQLQAIADALGNTGEGLTHNDIEFLLRSCGMNDPSPHSSKRHRIYDAFAVHQNNNKNRTGILAFIRKSMRPERFVRSPELYEPLRANLNKALSFSALAVDEKGTLVSSDKAETLTEAQRRANDLRTDMAGRGIHPDVLAFCRAELLADNYFHAVLEATKSIADKLRVRTGLTDDGGTLVDRALTGDPPMLAINNLHTESEKSEQRGFANLLKGTFGMFRNVTAHEARIRWSIKKEDAEDLLTLVSLIHRRIDACHIPKRA